MTDITQYPIQMEPHKRGAQFCFVYMLAPDTPKGGIIYYDDQWYPFYAPNQTGYLCVQNPYKNLVDVVKIMQQEVRHKGYNLKIADHYIDLPESITELELISRLDFEFQRQKDASKSIH